MATVDRAGRDRSGGSANHPHPSGFRALVSVRGSGSQAPRGRAASVLAFIATAALGLAGCRVNDADIQRWESTARGPRKLCDVLIHDKYDPHLRVQAGLSLVRMKPRGGRRVAFSAIDATDDPTDPSPCKKTLVDALASITPELRTEIVTALVNDLIAELKKPPPAAQAGQIPADDSFPLKDAAYAILTVERTPLIADNDPLKQGLKQALIEWAMADFEHRLDNRTQNFGMEQLLRYLGAPGVAGLPKIMTKEAKRLDQEASLVSELGDAPTKEAASKSVTAIAQYVVSPDWRKANEGPLKAANAASKLEPTPAQFEMQLSSYQEEELFRVFGSMKKIGGAAAVDFLLTFAAKKDENEKRRAAALGALEGRLDRTNPDHIKRILAIASADAPDSVLDQAFRRIGEMPREQVIDKLYDIFKTDKWKVRRAAAGTVLKMSTVKNIDEFVGKLPDQKGFAMTEAFTYGAMLGDLKDGTPLDSIRKHFNTGSGAQRASALAYWYTFGTAADVGALKEFEGDTTAAPVCDTDPDCKWSCLIPKEGGKPDEKEAKDVKSVGDFVKFCLEPEMKTKTADPGKK